MADLRPKPDDRPVVALTPEQQQQMLMAQMQQMQLGGRTGAAEGGRTVRMMVWRCKECGNECNTMKSENRCLCGHRWKEHKEGGRCAAGSCACKRFYYVYGQGAFILRCRCKHKHVDHAPNPPYACQKCKPGACKGFDSPWVCNCNHGWASHEHAWVERTLGVLPVVDEELQAAQVQRGLA
jgi:hypothetical protein